jgi:hypothetical protein
MAIKPSINAANRVSAELSTIMQALVNDPQRQQPPTLEDVRADLQQTGLQWSSNGELLHPQDRTSLLIELDGLIAQLRQPGICGRFRSSLRLATGVLL